VLRCQVAFEIGFSRKGLLVVTGADVATELLRSVFWLAKGSETRRGSTGGLLGRHFTADSGIM
jgi:hypothetical protein